jgi:hypothetical protein
MKMTTWRKEIHKAMKENEDKDVTNYITTLSEEELDTEFDNGYGGTNGLSFTLWTTWHVYFPLCYDGAEWCGSVYRNPTKIATFHQGGG